VTVAVQPCKCACVLPLCDTKSPKRLRLTVQISAVEVELGVGECCFQQQISPKTLLLFMLLLHPKSKGSESGC
jgi:hypothetical protein